MTKNGYFSDLLKTLPSVWSFKYDNTILIDNPKKGDTFKSGDILTVKAYIDKIATYAILSIGNRREFKNLLESENEDKGVVTFSDYTFTDSDIGNLDVKVEVGRFMYLPSASQVVQIIVEGSGDSSISYLSDNYMNWLTLAEGFMPYPYRDTKDNASMQNLKNVTLGIGFTFDNTGRNWDILKEILGWDDEEILAITNGAYSGTDYSKSKYTISVDQVYKIFSKVSEKIYMPNLNSAIGAFNKQNEYITTYSQRELEAMFDYSYNNGLSPTEDTEYTYSSAINDTDKIIYYYLRKDQQGGVDSIKRFGNGERRRLNQMNLFFKDYDFLDKTGEELNLLREKLGF